MTMSEDTMTPTVLARELSCPCVECVRIDKEGHFNAAGYEAVVEGYTLEEAVDRFKRAMIENAMKPVAFDSAPPKRPPMVKTAERLGISRKSLWELRRKYGLGGE